MHRNLVLVALMGLALLPTVHANTARDDICREDTDVPIVQTPEEGWACQEYREWRPVVNAIAYDALVIVCDLACEDLGLVLTVVYEAEGEVGESPVAQQYWAVRRTLVADSCPSSLYTCL